MRYVWLCKQQLQHGVSRTRRTAHSLRGLTQAEPEADRINDYIKAEMAKRQIPGLALGIVPNGELVSVALHQIPGDALPFRNP